MKEKAFTAWAIDTCSPEGHGLIGRYWWFNGRSHNPEPQHEGCKLCLWTTRQAAREDLKDVRGVNDGKYQPFPRARVVRVRVKIDW